LSWRSSGHTQNAEPIPVSVIPWKGRAHISGAFLLSRINLNFINTTCSKLKSDLTVTTQVIKVLTDTKLVGATTNQVRQYGFSILRLETHFQETLDYITALLLCSGRGGELWQAYSKLKEQIAVAWQLLRKSRTRIRSLEITNYFPNRRRETIQEPSMTSTGILNKLIKSNTSVSNNISRTVSPFVSSLINPSLPIVSPAKETQIKNNNSINIIELLESNRPPPQAERRSPILVGLGLGFLGNYVLGNYFSNNNEADIALLNKNINKNNKNLRMTNMRIDMLAKNVSNSISVIKNVLDKLVEAHQTSDIYAAIQWNMDQLASSIQNVRETFKYGELTVTMLNEGILNAELIDLKSFQSIIIEGLKAFPDMNFPLKVTRYQLKTIVKIIKIQTIGHLKYLMIIPLTRKLNFKIDTLIPHPIRLGSTDLVLPEIKDIMLRNNITYITTVKSNVYSLSTTNHLVLDQEPIFNINKMSCELAAVLKNTSLMLQRCPYKKVGQVNDTFVTETKHNRIIYFSEHTKVTLDCPEKKVRDTLIGLHKVPLSCDIQTEYVFWPAKQSVTVNLNFNESFILDSSYLPIISVNETDNVHTTLRELISKLPKKSDALVIDFNYHNLTLEEVQSYSVYTHSFTLIIILVNSILIGVLILKSKRNTTRSTKSSLRAYRSYGKGKFRDIRDSLRNSLRDKQTKFSRSGSIHSARDSIRSRGRTLRDSLRSKGSTLKNNMKTSIQMSPKIVKDRVRSRTSSRSKSPYRVSAETNTDWQLPPYAPAPTIRYPVLPKYN